MNIKTVDTCRLIDLLTIWNEGFSNYFVPVKMDLKNFIKRMANEDLEAASSFVIEENGKLLGVLLNGLYKSNDKLLAWNGGTAVHPIARRKGVGRLLLQKSIEEYQLRGVKRASLEAIKENTGAISLYKEFGYKIKDELIVFKGRIKKESTVDVEFTRPELLPLLPIFNEDVPWQCRLESNLTSQAAVFYDQSKNPSGYILFRQTNGERKQTKLIQIELLDTVTQEDFCIMISTITDGTEFTTVNTPLNSKAAKYLINLNTEEILRQVWMEIVISR